MRVLISAVAVAFVAGFGMAWWMKPVPETDADHSSIARARDRDGRANSSGGSRRSGGDELTLDRMLESRSRPGGLEGELVNTRVDEIPGLLEALAARAGLTGLSWEDEMLYSKLVKKWYQESPNEALSWAMAHGNPEDRSGMLSEMIDVEAEKDLDSALALAAELNRSVEGGIDPPMSLLQKGADRDIDSLMKACLLGLKKGDGSSGSSLTFGPDFDFSDALNRLADAEESAPEGHRLTVLPSNMLEEWVKRDPQVAFEWVMQGRELSFNSGLNTFIEEYSEVASDEELGSLVAELFDPQDESADRYEQSWRGLSEMEEEESVSSFLEGVSTHGSRMEHIQGLLEESTSYWGGGHDRARVILLEMLEPQERYRLLTSSDGERLDWGNHRETLEPLFLRLGHSEAEIDEMLPVTETE